MFILSKGAAPVWVSQAMDYTCRGVELRHLNALEFFSMYELQQRAVQQKAPKPNEDGRGRPPLSRVPLLLAHPLAAFYELRRRARFVLPVLSGGTPPSRPRPVGKNVKVGRAVWAGYFAALLIPWGSVTPDARGAQHFNPRLCPSALTRWWAALETESLRLAQQAALGDSTGPGTFRLGASSVSDRALWCDRVDPLGHCRPSTASARGVQSAPGGVGEPLSARSRLYLHSGLSSWGWDKRQSSQSHLRDIIMATGVLN
jgi:hypothetical protein